MNDDTDAAGCFSTLRLFFVLVIAAAVLTYAGGLIGCNKKSDDTKAKAGCRAAVNQRLVSPKSADYRYIRVDTEDDARWIVSGIVTSKNPLGVELESSFFCGFDGGEWPTEVDLAER